MLGKKRAPVLPNTFDTTVSVLLPVYHGHSLSPLVEDEVVKSVTVSAGSAIPECQHRSSCSSLGANTANT